MRSRIRVKICGITNLDDALLAVELGADALGFIFFQRSPRYITPTEAREIIEHLPPFVTPVAVVVNESIAAVSEIMSVSGCHLAQLHGEEPPSFLDRLAWPAIKGISIATALDLVPLAEYKRARAILLDTKVAGQYGGTGTTFDWQLVHDAKACGRPIIMAGGLTPENIMEAVATAHPHAIDIGSGVESTPGRKDPERLRRLFDAINAMEAQASPATGRG